MSQVIKCFLGSDLRMGHDGLRAVALKDKVKVDELGAGEFVIFINSAQDKVKVYAPNATLAYYRCRKGESLDMRVIGNIPKAFGAKGRIDFEELVRETLLEVLARKRRAVSE